MELAAALTLPPMVRPATPPDVAIPFFTLSTIRLAAIVAPV